MSVTALSPVQGLSGGIDYERLPVPTCLLQDGDRITSSNAAFHALFGVGQGGMMPERLRDLLAPAEGGRFLALLDRLGSGCCGRFELAGEGLAGQNLVLTLVPASEQGGALLQLYPLASAAAGEPRLDDHLREMIDTASDWFWETDAQMRFTYVSSRFEKITGLTVDEMLGKTWMEIATVEIEEPELKRYQDDIAHQRSFNNIVYKQVFAKGFVRHFRLRGRPVGQGPRIAGYRGVGSDITREKDAELRAYRAQQRFYQAIDNVAQGVAVFDIEGRLVACNSRYGNLHRRASDPRALAPRALYRDVLRARFASGFFVRPRGELDGFIEDRVRQCGEGEADHTYELADGRWIQDSWRLMPDGGSVSLLTDVTAARESENRREFLEQQLLRSQRLEVLGRLAGGLANDLNNALVPIAVFGKRVAAKLGPERDRQLLQPMIDAADRVQRLVKQILAFTVTHETDRGLITLRSLVEETLGMLRPSLPAEIAIELQLEDVPAIFADAHQLHQAMVHLITNAVEAIGACNGKIRIALTSKPREDAVVSLVISDDGVGMDEDTSRRAFEPFFTTKHPDEAPGLGLWVVHEIVTHHGGQIELKSATGSGTTIEIALPVARRSLFALETRRRAAAVR